MNARPFGVAFARAARSSGTVLVVIEAGGLAGRCGRDSSELRVVRASRARDFQGVVREPEPAHLFGRVPAEQDLPTNHEIDEWSHEAPVNAVRLSAPDEGGELWSIGVVAEMLEVRVHQQPVDRVIAHDWARMAAPGHKAEFIDLFHDLVLVVVPGVERREVAREPGAGGVAHRVPEAPELGCLENPRLCEARWRPVSLADQRAREFVFHALWLRLPR